MLSLGNVLILNVMTLLQPAAAREHLPADCDTPGFHKLPPPQNPQIRKAFHPEFGACRGLVRVLKSPSSLETAEEGENPRRGHFYFLRQTLVYRKPWVKRDLTDPAPANLSTVLRAQKISKTGKRITKRRNRALGCKIPWSLSRKPPALTSINRRKLATNPGIASINIC